jgi:hypothetical protein
MIVSLSQRTPVRSAGHYEFTRTADRQTFPARYSFVLLKKDGAWMIGHQHSSMLPEPFGA